MSLRTRSVVRQFLAYCRQARSPKTADYYAHHLAKLVKRVGNKIASKLRPADLTAWAKSWHETQAATRCFFWAATEANLLRRSPFSKVKLPPMRGRERIASPRELAKFLRGLMPAPRLFFLAMRETFARPQEIRAARICDLKTENPREPLASALPAGRALIVLKNFKSRERRADASRPRVLLISARLGRSIARAIGDGRASAEFIFLNTQGLPWSKNAIRCVVRRARVKLGIDRDEQGERFVAYTVRHSAATEAAAAGVLDRTLADLLGHVETKTTARYQHLCVGHLRAALARAQANARPPRVVKKRVKSGRSVPTSSRPRG